MRCSRLCFVFGGKGQNNFFLVVFGIIIIFFIYISFIFLSVVGVVSNDRFTYYT